jgi:hypothetical protein
MGSTLVTFSRLFELHPSRPDRLILKRTAGAAGCCHGATDVERSAKGCPQHAAVNRSHRVPSLRHNDHDPNSRLNAEIDRIQVEPTLCDADTDAHDAEQVHDPARAGRVPGEGAGGLAAGCGVRCVLLGGRFD